MVTPFLLVYLQTLAGELAAPHVLRGGRPVDLLDRDRKSDVFWILFNLSMCCGVLTACALRSGPSALSR